MCEMKICVTCGEAFEPRKVNFISCDKCRERRRQYKAAQRESKTVLLEQCKGQCFQCPFPDCYIQGELPRKYRTM